MSDFKPIHSDIFKAIVNKSKYTDEEADNRDKEAIAFQNHNYNLAIQQISAEKLICDKINIPSMLKKDELNSKPEAHPQFENYNHSLEIDRWKGITLHNSSEDGMDNLDDGIEMGDLTSNDI